MFRVLLATAKRNFIVSRRAYPWSFFVGRVITGAYTVLISLFLYAYLFQGQTNSLFSTYTDHADYLAFAILGAAFFTFAIASIMNVSRTLMVEVWEGTLETLLLSPSSRLGYMLGSLLEQILRATLELAVILLIGWVAGARFPYLHPVQILMVWVISIFALFSMSITLAALMLSTRDTYISQNTLFILMSLLCGVTFPIQYLPAWVQPLSHAVPFTAVLDLFRKVILQGHTIGEHPGLLIEIFALSAVYLTVGFLWLHRSERRFLQKIFG